MLLKASNHMLKDSLAMSINLSRMQLKMLVNGVITSTSVSSQKLLMTFTHGSEMSKESLQKLLLKQLTALLNTLGTLLKISLGGLMMQLLMPRTFPMVLIALKDTAHKTNNKATDSLRRNNLFHQSMSTHFRLILLLFVDS